MNRREFLGGAAALSVAMVGQQERYLVRRFGVPKQREVVLHRTALHGYEEQLHYLLKNPGMVLEV